MRKQTAYVRLFKRFSPALVVLAVTVLWALVPQRPDALKPERHRVAQVVDGDTLILEDGRKVRLLGVDTPEAYESEKLTRDAKRLKLKPALIQEWGRMASRYTKELASGQDVLLKFDPVNYDRGHLDPYGRLLAYVYLLEAKPGQWSDAVYVLDEEMGWTLFLNASIVKAGFGEVFRKFPFEHKKDFFIWEDEAKTEHRGLWQIRSSSV